MKSKIKNKSTKKVIKKSKKEEYLAELSINNLTTMSEKEFDRLMKWLTILRLDVPEMRMQFTTKKFYFRLAK